MNMWKCAIMGILEYNSCGEYEEMKVELHLLVDQWVRESMWILGLEKLKMEEHDWVWNMCECFDSVALSASIELNCVQDLVRHSPHGNRFTVFFIDHNNQSVKVHNVSYYHMN